MAAMTQFVDKLTKEYAPSMAHRRGRFWLILATCLLLGACAPRSMPLFNGKDLDGWTKVGGDATYTVVDGTIIGTRGPGPNTFLRTNDTYDDFILQLEFKWNQPINSGVQFRSHQREEDGRVSGYQCELDPSDRGWTGGLFDEAGRGWLVSLKDDPKAMAAVTNIDQWNQMRIEARGDHLQTWVNGVPCAQLTDTNAHTGFIALQVHSATEPGQICWRRIQITPLQSKSE